MWARADEFRLDVSVGVPPDAFSPTGQDWGLPAYRLGRDRREWLRVDRGSAHAGCAALYDGIRVDHVVGLYRTYGRPAVGGSRSSRRAEEPRRSPRAKRSCGLLRESGLALIAEDLGVIPDFVRESLVPARLAGLQGDALGADWHDRRATFRRSASVSAVSAAMTGTHDTEPLALWWEVALPEERAALLAMPAARARGLTIADDTWTPVLRDLLIELAYSSASHDVFLPVQDVFGWRERINTPGTVSVHNWTWVLPWPVDGMNANAVAVERAAFLRSLAAATGRVPLLAIPAGPEN